MPKIQAITIEGENVIIPADVFDYLCAMERRIQRPDDDPDCFWRGEDRFDLPTDADIVAGLNVGDRFELEAAWYKTITFVVSKVPDAFSDDYEVRVVSSDGEANGH
jgi:hypothetical protein